MASSLYEQIYEVTQKIPAGQVATYGQIARLAGIPKGARQVGYAMAALGRGRPRPEIPWIGWSTPRANRASAASRLHAWSPKASCSTSEAGSI